MQIRRRTVLAGIGGALTVPALPVFGQTTPLPRQRLEAFSAAPGRLAALRRGVSVMKARKPSDPTSWFYQGAIHDVSNEAIEAATLVDPDVAKVDQAKFWRRCPHHGQASAEFLLWHRAYLYHFERILREASGDPQLSLPYWNYTQPGQRTFPVAFARAERDPVTGIPRNPLYDDRREHAFMFGLYELSEGAAGGAALASVQEFFGESESQGFAGGVADNDPFTKGRAESQPHDAVHYAIGGEIGLGDAPDSESAIGLMSSTATAAFDPIFWVHHCNIDRLWTDWECLLPARTWGMVPPKEWLEAKPWFFNDIGGVVENRARAHYLDRRNFPAVSYDSDVATCKPLSATPLPTGAATGGGVSPLNIQPGIKSFSTKAVAGQHAQKTRVSPDAPVQLELNVQALPPALGGTLKNSVLNATAKAPRRVQLEIGGLAVEGITSSGFDVYLNLPAGVTPSRAHPAYVGTLALFGLGTPGPHAGHGTAQRFDITRQMAAQTIDPSKLAVSIVPFDLLTPKAGQPRLRRAAGVTFERLRVLVLEGSSNPIM